MLGHVQNRIKTSCTLLLTVLLSGQFAVNAGTLGKKEDEAMSYIQKEVVFFNKDVTLAGTLTLPRTSGRHPAVVLLHGSGPLNRDHEFFGMKTFWIIADHLTRRGVAVLRYDSRGVGGSGGAPYQFTLQDVAEDALAAIRYLKTRNDINPARIGLCGISQGAIVAPIAASGSEDVAFIICLAGIGVPGAQAQIAQMTSIAKANGASEQEIAELVENLKRIISLVRNEADEAEIRPLITTMLKNQCVSMSQKSEKQTQDNKAADTHVDCVLSWYKSPWFRFFIDYDPKTALKQVMCPALFLFGELDTQVPLQANRTVIGDVLKKSGNKDYTLKTIPGANHVFQVANTGSPYEYLSLEKKFAPGFLEFVSDWVLKRVDIVTQ
ncbi:MAG: alpha/beta fold hydrolase [Calditrichae bacterium]|nr:alpha/beta fold hydrolase [Calditrichia bacterium]